MATVEVTALTSVLESGVPACVITHGLKVLGGGSMQRGLMRYGEKMFTSGLRRGRIEGVIIGAAMIGIPTVTAWGISKIKKSKTDSQDSTEEKKVTSDAQASSNAAYKPEGDRTNRMCEPVTA